MKHTTKQESDKAIADRVRKLHANQGCLNWEVWTENVRLIEGGCADVTFDGCRKHGVALAR